jgi:P27 family predicted phage terminase small subunit
MKTLPPVDLQGAALDAWIMFAEQIGDVKPSDLAALKTLAVAWAEMHTCQREIDANGTVIKLPNGYPGPNPYCKPRDKAQSVVTKLILEFGLTPAARAKSKTSATKTTDDTAELEF